VRFAVLPDGGDALFGVGSKNPSISRASDSPKTGAL